MSTELDSLKTTLRRWTLILGVLQITVGCSVGFIPPSAVSWFRGIVMAHLEFTANGVLMVAFAFLVREMRLGPLALKAWFVLLQVGTWTNGMAGVAAAFLGTSSKLLPTLNEKFPLAARHGPSARHRLADGLRRDNHGRAAADALRAGAEACIGERGGGVITQGRARPAAPGGTSLRLCEGRGLQMKRCQADRRNLAARLFLAGNAPRFLQKIEELMDDQ